MKKFLFLFLAFLFSGLANTLYSQVVIGENIGNKHPHQAAALDLNDGSNKGLKLPNVSLNVDSTIFVLDGGTSLNQVQAAGMMVYNTNSAVTGGKGIYYWDGIRWWKAVPYGEMQISDSYIWVSPVHDSKNIQIVSNAAWTIETQPDNATVSPTSGNVGTTNITVSKNYSTNTDYGPHTFNIKYTSDSEIAATITVDALYIWEDELMLNNDPGVNTEEYEIEVDGGSQTFMVVDSSTWLTSATVLPNGKLQLVADQEPFGELRTGFVKLAHTTDPDYIVQLIVEQDVNGLPPFDYLTVRFTWAASDVDIAVEFRDNVLPGVVNPVPSNSTHWVPFDNNPVYPTQSASRAMGFGLANFVNVDGSRGTVYSSSNVLAPLQIGDINPTGTAAFVPPFQGASELLPQTALMLFGGDATLGQGETVFINAPLITPPSRREDNTGWDRYVYIDVYAGWYSNPPTPKGVADSIRVTVSTYTGGIMVKPEKENIGQGLRNTNFYNVAAGTTSAALISASQILPPDYSETFRINTNGRGNSPSSFRTTYPKFCTIRYDRYKRDAKIVWETFPSPSAPFRMMEEPTPKPKEKE